MSDNQLQINTVELSDRWIVSAVDEHADNEPAVFYKPGADIPEEPPVENADVVLNWDSVKVVENDGELALQITVTDNNGDTHSNAVSFIRRCSVDIEAGEFENQQTGRVPPEQPELDLSMTAGAFAALQTQERMERAQTLSVSRPITSQAREVTASTAAQWKQARANVNGIDKIVFNGDVSEVLVDPSSDTTAQQKIEFTPDSDFGGLRLTRPAVVDIHSVAQPSGIRVLGDDIDISFLKEHRINRGVLTIMNRRDRVLKRAVVRGGSFYGDFGEGRENAVLGFHSWVTDIFPEERGLPARPLETEGCRFVGITGQRLGDLIQMVSHHGHPDVPHTTIVHSGVVVQNCILGSLGTGDYTENFLDVKTECPDLSVEDCMVFGMQMNHSGQQNDWGSGVIFHQLFETAKVQRCILMNQRNISACGDLIVEDTIFAGHTGQGRSGGLHDVVSDKCADGRVGEVNLYRCASANDLILSENNGARIIQHDTRIGPVEKTQDVTLTPFDPRPTTVPVAVAGLDLS